METRAQNAPNVPKVRESVPEWPRDVPQAVPDPNSLPDKQHGSKNECELEYAPLIAPQGEQKTHFAQFDLGFLVEKRLVSEEKSDGCDVLDKVAIEGVIAPFQRRPSRHELPDGEASLTSEPMAFEPRLVAC